MRLPKILFYVYVLKRELLLASQKKIEGGSLIFPLTPKFLQHVMRYYDILNVLIDFFGGYVFKYKITLYYFFVIEFCKV